MKKILFVTLLCSPLIACSSNDKDAQQCIDKIVELTSVSRICDQPVGDNGVDFFLYGKTQHYTKQEAEEKGIFACSEPAKYAVVVRDYGMLSQEDALAISENWNYDDIKLYNNEEEEKGKGRSR